jgi:cell division protein FtsQ
VPGRVEDRRWRLVRARREALAPSVRRWYRRSAVGGQVIRRRTGTRIGAVRRRWWLMGTVAVAVVAASAWMVFGTSVLSVREVRVTGSHIAGVERVRAAADVADGTPLATVDTAAVADRVREIPSVADVDVSRSWPSTLVIVVTERKPVAVVRSGPTYLVLDAGGVVFDQVATRPAGVLLLDVASPGPDDAATRAGLTVALALTPGLLTRTKQLVADSSTSIHLDLVDGRVVIWGDAAQSEVKARVATSLLDRAQNRIDVSAPNVVAVS